MTTQTKFILDSGNPEEYKEIAKLANEKGSQLWGGTTNPTLIAKTAMSRLNGKKITSQEAFDLQKKLIFEILEVVEGAVSAEVFADEETKGEQMAEQGKEIAAWDKRIVVKLPTTVEGFKARSILRKVHIPINNTLVFSQTQIFAICLHEQIMQKEFGPIQDQYPPFISPFVGRLDDIGENGVDLVKNGMKIKGLFNCATWMLEASVRSIEHFKLGIEVKSELITAPAKVYKEWFDLPDEQKEAKTKVSQNLKPILEWNPPQELFTIHSEDEFFHSLESSELDIFHPLTEKGIELFTADWNAVVAS